MEPHPNKGDRSSQLFRAYNVEASVPRVPEDPDWLRNKSFKYDHPTVQLSDRGQESDNSNTSSESHLSFIGEIEDICVPPVEKRKLDPEESSYLDGIPEVKKFKKAKKEKKKKKRKKHKKHRDEKGNATDVRNFKEETISHAETRGKVFIDQMFNLSPEDAYRIDRKPDANNLTYGCLYAMHIAKYHRVFNSVLGLGVNQMVTMGKGKQHRDKYMSRYFGKENTRKLQSDHDEEEIIIDMSANMPQEHSKFRVQSTRSEQYIPIDLQEEQKHISPESLSASALGMHGPSSSNTKISSVSKPNEVHLEVRRKETEHHKIQRQLTEFNRYLRENPHDVDKWIQFVNFQDKALIVRDKDTTHAKKKERINQVLLDIKLSIIEKALEKNPASLDLKKLQLLLGAEVLSTSKLGKEWKQLTFNHPNNPDVWWHYLLFLQSNLSSFSVSTVVKAHGKCLSTFESIRNGTLKSHGQLPYAEEHMIYVLHMLAMFLKQAGHLERAVAVYQAMIELNVFCPDVLKKADKKEKLDFLEAFWDSAVPRFGENGSNGWGHWVHCKGEVPFLSMYESNTDEETEEGILLSEENRSKLWLSLETSRMSRHWLPWRPDVRNGETEEDCEDPERLIMFDDISTFLFEVTSEDNMLSLVLNLFSLIKNSGVEFTFDSFPSRSLLAQRIQQYELESCDDLNVDDLDLANCRQRIEMDKEKTSQFVENALYQASRHFDGHARTRLTLRWIHLKVARIKVMENDLKKDKKLWKTSGKELKKWIKDILKEETNRNNILLWEAYATTEDILGNRNDSVNVLDTVLTMHIPPGGIMNMKSTITQCEICKLCRTYAETELGIGKPRTGKDININKDRALHVLCSLADNERYRPKQNRDKVAPTTILRARRNYQSLVSELSKNEVNDTERIIASLPEAGCTLVHLVVCFAYFQYLSVDVHAASVVFQQCSENIKLNHKRSEVDESMRSNNCFNLCQRNQQKVLEELTEAHISLLEYHIDTEVSPMRILRIPLQQAIREYPDNKHLLMTYAYLESRGGIRGQLRRRLHDAARLSRTPAVWLSAVVAELKSIRQLQLHNQYMSQNYKMFSGFNEDLVLEPSTKHQLRAWFEKALDEAHNKHCILLWRLFMHTEATYGETSSAKAIFYRAVKECPRAKMIYLDFLHYFPDKLQEVTDLLVEKEHRVRIPLEELDLLLANKGNITSQIHDTNAENEST